MPTGLHFANNGWSALFVNARGDVIVTDAPLIGPSLARVIIDDTVCQAVLVCCAVEWLMRRRDGVRVQSTASR